jgi:nicotinate phosphoribosyltransferase
MNKNKSIEAFNKESLLFNDLYKFTMMWAVISKYPNSKVRYEFFDRNNTVYPDGFGTELRKIVDTFRHRKISAQRLKEFEKACPYLPKVFFDFINGYRFDPSEVGIIQNGGKLSITIDGYHYRTILWEVPLMAAISELYHKMTAQVDLEERLKNSLIKTASKAELFRMNNIQFVDFGTRRAFSPEHHANVVSTISSSMLNSNFIGSSNIELALTNGLKVIGTYAHEFVSGIAALNGYIHANKRVFEDWTDVYGGSLGIALTDTFTTDAFLYDFDSKFANLFSGVRQDSGDVFEFTDKIIKHYKSLNIDPTTKTIVYSDALNPELVLKIDSYRKNEIRKSYGIGTNLTCDIENVKPLNIVIKLVEINGIPAIKLSDSLTKHIGDEETIKFVKWQIGQRLR